MNEKLYYENMSKQDERLKKINKMGLIYGFFLLAAIVILIVSINFNLSQEVTKKIYLVLIGTGFIFSGIYEGFYLKEFVKFGIHGVRLTGKVAEIWGVICLVIGTLCFIFLI